LRTINELEQESQRLITKHSKAIKLIATKILQDLVAEEVHFTSEQAGDCLTPEAFFILAAIERHLISIFNCELSMNTLEQILKERKQKKETNP